MHDVWDLTDATAPRRHEMSASKRLRNAKIHQPTDELLKLVRHIDALRQEFDDMAEKLLMEIYVPSVASRPGGIRSIAIMRGWLQKIGIALFVAYAIIGSFSALYFNYRVAQTGGFAYWVMFGEVEATLRVWCGPISWCRNIKHQTAATTSSLSDDEWSALERVLPTVRKPSFTPADLATAKAILDGFAARTGHPARASELEAQLRFNQALLEWRAEVSASVAASWNNGTLTKTPRYVELTERFSKYPTFDDDQQQFNQVIVAASKHTEYDNAQRTQRPHSSVGRHGAPVSTSSSRIRHGCNWLDFPVGPGHGHGR